MTLGLFNALTHPGQEKEVEVRGTLPARGSRPLLPLHEVEGTAGVLPPVDLGLKAPRLSRGRALKHPEGPIEGGKLLAACLASAISE